MHDEIEECFTTRVVNAAEARQKIMKYKKQKASHAVNKLHITLKMKKTKF